MFKTSAAGISAIIGKIARNRNFGTHRVLNKYIISFILVFIIPSMFIFMFYNSYTSNMIMKKAEDELKTRFLKNTEEIDKRIFDIKDLMLRISFDQETKSIGNAKKIDSDLLFKMNQYSKLIGAFCIFSNYVKNAAVYYNNFDILMTQMGKDSVYSHFNRFSEHIGVTGEDMKSMLRGEIESQIIPNSNQDFDMSQIQFFVMAQSFPVNSNKPAGTVILMLDKILFSQNLVNADPKFNDNFIIMDRNKNILMSSNNKRISIDILHNIIDSGNQFSRNVSIDGIKSAVLCKRSEAMGLWYVYCLPEKALAASLSDSRKSISVILLLYIIGGLCMALMTALFNYNPVRVLMKDIMNKHDNEQDGNVGKLKKDEYGLIREYIDDLNNEKNNLRTKVGAYLTEVKSNFLRELLAEGLDESKFMDISRTLDLKFCYPRYCFINFNWNRRQNMSTDDVNNEFHILGLFEKLASDYGTVYKFNLHKDSVGFILNLREEADIKIIAEGYRGLAGSVNDTFDRQIMVGLGSIYDGFDRIPSSYNEACEAGRYGQFYNCSVFTWDNVLGLERDKYYYHSDVMDKLVNYLESNNKESMEKLLLQIIEFNFSERRLSMNLVKKLYYDLVGTLKRVLERHNYNISDIIAHDGGITENDNFTNLGDMVRSIMHSFEAVCDYLSQNREKIMDDKAAQIIRFIKDSYSDANLSCGYVADRFSVSQPSISYIVKKYSGMSYVDYVNKLRLDKAKLLLSDNELNVTEIANRLGYGSSNSFIRTFKNYEGITPGQYKNSFFPVQEPV